MAEVYFEKAKQVANSLTIQFNGTSKGSFNGSSGITINITPSAIGAAASSHSHSWNSITSKPSTFTPAAHSHAWGDISGKPSTFTPASHSHSWSSITGKPSTFAPSSHTHDDRYYTESEMNTKLNAKLNTSGGTITGNLDVNGDLSASRGRNGYFRVGRYNAGFWSSSSQHLYIAASIGEHDYALVHGVTDNMWSFYPYKNNLQHVGSPTYRFRTIYLMSTADVASDRRLKHDIEPIDERYENLFFSLIPRTYRLNDEKDDNKVHTGFIAQEVEDSILKNGLSQKELAALSKTEVETEDGIKDYNYGLRYEEFISLNTHMIQKLYKIIDELKEEVALLKNSK